MTSTLYETIQQARQNNPGFEIVPAGGGEVTAPIPPPSSQSNTPMPTLNDTMRQLKQNNPDLEIIPAEANAEQVPPDDSISSAIKGIVKSIGKTWEETTVDDVTNWVRENQDVAGGIGGAIAGGILGFLTPVPGGTLIGAVMGPTGLAVLGAGVGTGIGSVTTDMSMDRDIDFVEALEKAATSVGIDVVTLGLGKYIGKPIWNTIKTRMMNGEDAGKIVKELSDTTLAAAPDAGTTASKIQTQAILAPKGETLTKWQHGLTGPFSKFLETIGRGGIVSSKVYKDSLANIGEIAKERMAKITGPDSVSYAQLGEAFEALRQGAKEATTKIWGARQDQFAKELGNQYISFESVTKALNQFPLMKGIKKQVRVTPAMREAGEGSVLGQTEKEILNDLTKFLSAKKGSPGFLIQFHKHVNEIMTPAFKKAGGDEYRRLTQLKNLLTKAVESDLKKGVGDNAATLFKTMNSEYAEALGQLAPELTSSFIKNTGNKGAESVGKMFADSGNAAQVKAAIKTMNFSFEQMKKAGVSSKEIPFTKIQFRKSMASSYIHKRLSDLASDGPLNAKHFIKEAYNLKDVNYAEKAKAVLGPYYNGYKRTVNMMAEANTTPTQGMFALVQRGQEVGTMKKLLQTAGKGLTKATGMAVTGTGAILGGPYFIAKVATNPKHVNKLLAINSLGPEKELRKTKLASILINDVIDQSYNDADNLNEGQEAERRIRAVQ